MLKFQISLILILIGCMAIMSCSRTHDALEDVMMDPEPEMMDDYKSWEHAMLAGAVMDFGGEAHDLGARIIYFNEAAATANKDGTDYPVGSVIVKESMDTANTFISQISTMTKIDSADNDGWEYGVSGPPAATAEELMMTNQLTAEMGMQACHFCHAKAPDGKSVFVSLKMDEEMMEGMGEGTEGMGEGTEDNGDGNGGTNGDGNGGTNGNGNGGNEDHGSA